MIIALLAALGMMLGAGAMTLGFVLLLRILLERDN